MDITVLLESGPLVLSAQPGQSLLDVLREHGGLPIHAPCGGQGTCEKCTVTLSGPEGETPVLACSLKNEESSLGLALVKHFRVSAV